MLFETETNDLFKKGLSLLLEQQFNSKHQTHDLVTWKPKEKTKYNSKSLTCSMHPGMLPVVFCSDTLIVFQPKADGWRFVQILGDFVIAFGRLERQSLAVECLMQCFRVEKKIPVDQKLLLR